MKKNLLFCRLNSNFRLAACFILLIALSSSFSFAQDPVLYGMTYEGGIYGYGNIFVFSPNPVSYTNEVNFTGTSGSYLGESPHYGHLIQAYDGNFYGMTAFGGANTDGNIFKYSPSTGTYTDLIDFTGETGDYVGLYPYGSLVQAIDSNLYGMTIEGGADGFGNIFKYNIKTGAFTDLLDFTGTTGAYLGLNPWGNLIQAYDSNLYGMTTNGGTDGSGNIFKYNPATGAFTDLVDFINGTGNLGRNPTGSLVQAYDSILYGMTDQGGAPSYIGSLFSYNIATNTFTNLVFFTGTTGDYIGYGPNGSLIQATDTNLYGMTESGGATGDGNMFKYNPTSNTFTDLLDFTDQTGSYPGASPQGTLLQASDGNIYGMTELGGANNYGNIFQYNITTGAYADLVDFTGTTGSDIGQNPEGDLMEYTPATTGIKSISNLLSIKIYPNPNNGIFTIAFSYSELVSESQTIVEIYNVLGQQIYSATFQPQTPKGALIAINLSSQPDGVYLYRVVTREGNLIGEGKVIIAKV